MESKKASPGIGLLLVLGALLACGGKEAVEDLEKLKEKTCSCKGDKACLDEAKTMAREWGSKHKNAMGGDQQKAEQLMKDIMGCDLTVAVELGKGAEEATK